MKSPESSLLSFGQNEMSKEINITSLHDTVGEGDEIVVFRVMGVNSNDITVKSNQPLTTVTIVEDDSKTRIFVGTDNSNYYYNYS